MEQRKREIIQYVASGAVILAAVAVVTFLLLRPAEPSVVQAEMRYVKSMYAPTTFDPKEATDVASITVVNLLYSGLLEFSPDLKLRGDLAESWHTSTDGRTLFFTLRPRIYFHDGTRLTTKHVVASLSRVLAPHSKLYGYYDAIEGAEAFHRGLKNSVKGLIALSDHDLAIRLKAPFPPFLSVLAGATAKVLPITRPEAELHDFFHKPIGTGPFKFESSSPNSLMLRRFEMYHGTKPRISTLVLDYRPQPVALKEAIGGRVHDLVSWAATSDREAVFRYGQNVEAPIAETWIVGLNGRLEPFRDVRVRRAFKMDFPAEAFRERFYPNMEKATGYVPPMLPGHLSETESNTIRESLRHLPWKRVSTPIQIAMIEGVEHAAEIRHFIESEMADKGWRVRVVEMPWPKMMKGYDKKTLPAFLISMNMDYPDPEFLFRNFQSNNPDNFSGLRNPFVDSLLVRARGIVSRIEREKVYRTLSQRIEEESVTVNILHGRGNYWLHPCVRGFVPNTLSYVYVDYRTIYLDAQCLASRSQQGRQL